MEITIGKFTLETLTLGMYDRPIDLYREYIQNSVDAIDNALKSGLITKEKAKVEIVISAERREIIIADNGIGISSANAERFLLDIGNSTKRHTCERGFRGIGRLAGLAYCKFLIFETSAAGEDKKTVIKFDADKLRSKMLCDEAELDLQSIMTNVVTVESEPERKAVHYFTVKLHGVEDIDDILDGESVKKYLSQAAPVDFSTGFKWGSLIRARMDHLGFGVSSYNISVKGDDFTSSVYKGYSDIFIADRLRKLEDSISEIRLEKFEYNGDTLAVLWYAQTNCYGTIQDETIKGIRMRKGNIQLGNRASLNHIFKDDRFNGWLIGELHIVSNSLIPNARRDDLEKNTIYVELISQLKTWAEGIATEIRKISNARNNDKKAQQIIEIAKTDPQTIVEDVSVSIQPEIALAQQSENNDVNHSELISALDIIIGTQISNTKYKALNLQSNITVDQKKILERVFDIICSEYCHGADDFITTILRKFVAKTVVANV
ncbi:MAG: ATP-binding protein [Firmicutes bacterium]|nr:ATP-binding protein [Bacillota bacterium]